MSNRIDRLSPASFSARLPNLFFALAVLFGLIFIFLEPPFVCPDENAHFLNVCRISHGSLFANVSDGKIGCIMTEEEIDFLLRYGGYYNGQETLTGFGYAQMRGLIGRAPSETMVFMETQFATINPTPYLLASFAVSVCSFIAGGLNAYSILLIGKIVNLFFYAAVIRFALRKTAAFQKTMFLIALMPMALFQGASLSYDAILIPSAFLLFAYATKLLTAPEDYVISRGDLIGVSFACAMLFGCKIAYAPLVLILLAISVKKFGSRKKWWMCVGTVAAMGVLFYLIPALANGIITRGIVDTPTELELAQSAYFSENFWHFPVVLFKTAEQFGSYWAHSFLGILGWLDTVMPPPFLCLFAVILLFTVLTELCHTKGIRPSARLLSLFAFIAFYVGTVYIMYVEWNPAMEIPTGGDIAYGVQGRYFIPIILFVFLAGANNLLERFSCKEKLEDLRDKLVGFTALAACILSSLLLLVRYWAL